MSHAEHAQGLGGQVGGDLFALVVVERPARARHERLEQVAAPAAAGAPASSIRQVDALHVRR